MPATALATPHGQVVVGMDADLRLRPERVAQGLDPLGVLLGQ